VLPESAAEALRQGYGLVAARCVPLAGGEACAVFRIETPEPLVVRLTPPGRGRADLAWAYAIAAQFARLVPEVVAPRPTRDGRLVVAAGDQALSVWPAVPGRHIDRDDPAGRAAAARLLAALHRAAGELPVGCRPPPQPAPGNVDPRAAAVPDADRHGTDLSDVEDGELSAALRQWRSEPGWPAGPVHGDFYRANLLWHAGRITGLIDWDEVRVDRFAGELAWSTWEFAKAATGDRLLADRADDFLRTYERAGGPPYPAGMIIPLIRERLRIEIDRSRTAAATGGYFDPDYEAAEVRAFLALAR
jgi:Ser/Thr protein kinase RdoA (MazF antagonist)